MFFFLDCKVLILEAAYWLFAVGAFALMLVQTPQLL